jgi:hypothetical protein
MLRQENQEPQILEVAVVGLANHSQQTLQPTLSQSYLIFLVALAAQACRW